VLAFQEARNSAANGGTPGATSRGVATTMRHIALVFTWGAIAMAATYGTGILTWREWWQFMLAFVVLAGLSLFVSSALAQDGAAGKDDASSLRLARILALVLVVAMPIVMAGLALHDGRALKLGGKMANFFTEAGQRPNWQDWGANSVFFFGALAAAALAWSALSAIRGAQPSK
jgi:hypothetical protein